MWIRSPPIYNEEHITFSTSFSAKFCPHHRKLFPVRSRSVVSRETTPEEDCFSISVAHPNSLQSFGHRLIYSPLTIPTTVVRQTDRQTDRQTLWSKTGTVTAEVGTSFNPLRSPRTSEARLFHVKQFIHIDLRLIHTAC